MSKQLQKEIQQEYLSEFSTNVHRRHDPHHFMNNEQSFKARGIKSLQQPTVYILAVIFAFCLYQLDRLYDLRQVYTQQSQNLNEMKENLKTIPAQTQEMPSYWVLAISLVILTLVIAFKRVYQRKQKLNEEAQKKVIEQAEYEDLFSRKLSLRKPVNACEKINEEEFNYQANVTTRREITKLVNSQEYKDALIKKGQNQSSWNWQAYDRDQGIIPNGEDREIEGFDLVEELDQVDDHLNIGRSKVSLKYKTSRLNMTADVVIGHQKSTPSQLKSRKLNQDPNLASPSSSKQRGYSMATPSTLASVKQFSLNPKRTSL
eukprot:403359416